MAREFARAFYNSKDWKKVREYIYNKHHGLCRCGSVGEEVHHKIWLTPDNINDASISLGEDNLILLCKNCHINIHREKEVTREGTYFNEYGELVQDGE